MIVQKIFGFTLLLTAINTTFAMQPLEDQDLAESTGQDGLTVSIGAVNGKYMFDSISIEDNDGISSSTTHDNSAALSYITTAANTGVSFYSGTTKATPIGTAGTAIAIPVNLVMDAVGGTDPTLNVAIRLDPNLTRLKLDPFSLALNRLDANKAIIATNQRTLLNATNGIAIDFKSGNPVVLNMQLGHQPQNALFKFSSGSIEKITASGLEVVSYTSGVAAGKITLDLELEENNSTNGFRLSGIYIDPTTDGLLIGKAGDLDPFDLKINNLTMGNAGSQSTNVFNNLKNGSIGNIGLTGITITDFKATVKGM